MQVNAFVSGGFLPTKMQGTTYTGFIAGWDWCARLAGLATLPVETPDSSAALVLDGWLAFVRHDLMMQVRDLLRPRWGRA